MATGRRVKYDGVETYLEYDMGSGDTTISFHEALKSDGGKLINTLTSGEYMSLTILDENYRLVEIVHMIQYSSGAFTGVVERAQEGTDPAKAHAAGRKVVHAPTADDFFDIQTHKDDPNAHQAFIQSAVNSAVAAAMANHKNPAVEADPHSQYLLENNVVLPPNTKVPSGSVITVEAGGKIIINQGGELIVNGDLKIEGTGRLLINGKQLYISNDEPTNPTSNMVWLKTFG